MCCDVKLIPPWIWLHEAASLCGPKVNIVLCYSVWRQASETRPTIKLLLAHISPGRVTAGWNGPGTEGKEMKGSARGLRHQGEVRGRVGGGVRGEEEEKTADQRRGSGGWMKAKMRKKWVNVAPVIKRKKTGSRRESCMTKREKQQNVKVMVLSYRSCTRCMFNLLIKNC